MVISDLQLLVTVIIYGWYICDYKEHIMKDSNCKLDSEQIIL